MCHFRHELAKHFVLQKRPRPAASGTVNSTYHVRRKIMIAQNRISPIHDRPLGSIRERQRHIIFYPAPLKVST